MSEITLLNQYEKEDIYLLSNFHITYKVIDPIRGEVIFKNLFINYKWFFYFTYLIKNANVININNCTKFDIYVYNFYLNYNIYHLPLFVSGISSIDLIKENEKIIFPLQEVINSLYYRITESVPFLEVKPPIFNYEKKLMVEFNADTQWLSNLFKEFNL